jgi:CO/xanthine dehydrogenase FAD-binding subunit
MRARAADFELLTPKSLDEALRLLDGHPGTYRPLAGGTDVMVLFGAGKLAHSCYVSLWGLAELSGIHVDDARVTLGALTTYTEVQAHPVLRAEFPMLCQAGFETGGVAIQNRGTLGGNIANASPAADSPPALLAYDAELELVSANGSRWVRYDGFHTGYKQMILAPNEIVAKIRLSRTARDRVHYYRKVGPRKAQAISKVCFAGAAELDGAEVAKVLRVGIALGGVAPIVPRCPETEAVVRALPDNAAERPAWRAAARDALAREIAPIDDIRSNARYRRKVAENLLVEFLLRIEKRVGLAP